MKTLFRTFAFLLPVCCGFHSMAYAGTYPFMDGESITIPKKTTFNSIYSCQKLYAPNGSPFFELIGDDATLSDGDKVLVQGQLKAESPQDTAILQSARVRIKKPGDAVFSAINSGENNVGSVSSAAPDSDPEGRLIVGSQYLMTAATAGSFHFYLETRAETTSSDPDLTLAPNQPCPSNGGDYEDNFLAINTGSGSTFLQAWAVHPKAEQFLETHRWSTGYGTANANNSPIEFLRSSWTMGGGYPDIRALHASAFIGTTVDNTDHTTITKGKIRLVVQNVDQSQTYYFPTKEGYDFSATGEKHHKKLYLNGVIPYTSSDNIYAFVELSYLSGGGWVRVDTGCKNNDSSDTFCDTSGDGSSTPQASLILWPSSTTSGPIVQEYRFKQSSEGWMPGHCAGYYHGFTLNSSAISSPGVLGAAEESNAVYSCNSPETGNLEMAFYQDIANFGTTLDLSGWTKSTASYSGSSDVINRCVKILNADSYAVLWSQCDDWHNVTSSGWDQFDYSIDTSVFSAPRLRIVVGAQDSWSANWQQQIFIDDLEVSIE